MHPIIAILSEDGAGLSPPENDNSDVGALLGNFVPHKYSNDELTQISQILENSSENQNTTAPIESGVSMSDLSTIISKISEKNDYVSFVLLRSCALYGCQKHDDITVDE